MNKFINNKSLFYISVSLIFVSLICSIHSFDFIIPKCLTLYIYTIIEELLITEHYSFHVSYPMIA